MLDVPYLHILSNQRTYIEKKVIHVSESRSVHHETVVYKRGILAGNNNNMGIYSSTEAHLPDLTGPIRLEWPADSG